jgi:hypothetical protein
MAACTVVTNFVPPQCPDNCTGHGQCVNVTSANYNQSQATDTAFGTNVTAFCSCIPGYTGVNCGQGAPPPFSLTEVLATSLSVAAIVAIIVCAVIVAVACAGGGAFAYAQAAGGGGAGVVANNPLYKGPDFSGTNPLNKI